MLKFNKIMTEADETKIVEACQKGYTEAIVKFGATMYRDGAKAFIAGAGLAIGVYIGGNYVVCKIQEHKKKINEA